MNFLLVNIKNYRNTTLMGLTLSLLLLPILNGCSNSIESIDNKATYSVYAVFELKTKTNYIRIKNLTVPLVLNSKKSLNATVHLKNLKTGDTQLLTSDSLVNFEGVVIHNLKITTPIQPLTTYEVIIKRNSDGHTFTKRVTTPQPTTITVAPQVDPCGTIRTITYDNIIAGETLVAYAVAVRKIPPKGPPTYPPKPSKPQKKFFIHKFFNHFEGTGEFGSKSISGYHWNVNFPCTLKSSKIYVYSAIYGPGYDKNDNVNPDSINNIDRFLKSKLLAVVKDTVTFTALLNKPKPDTTKNK